ncbi:unnamed protein product [Prunus armeniaca]|uniref:Exoribonuclease phosphorolytic domain-containing protein n=1 Tax=Prunus armeniaca TaxID=36596 RepID=A0A6J5VC67_PRUAR|nr:unnamed protein product [Prunus armeniaca]CAB4315953.1 unnamed protein product [Prunus armeniaca]
MDESNIQRKSLPVENSCSLITKLNNSVCTNTSSYEETSPENCSVDHEADLKNSREFRWESARCPRYCYKEKSSGMTYLLKKLMFPKAALSNTGIPKVNVAAGASGDEQPEVDVSDEEFLQFDTSRVPVIVTLTKVGRHYIVDATSEEESQMCLAVSISINRQGRICGLTKRGGAGLDPSIILDMISVAKTVSEQLINTLDSHIAAAEAGEEES